MIMKARSYTNYVQVQVDPKVTKISNVSNLELYTGSTAALAPKLAPNKYAAEPITFRSADKDVATVSKSGEVTAKNVGGTTITIAAGGAEKTINVVVMSAPVRSTSGSSKSSSKGSSKSSGGHSGDYFGDDEYF